MWVEWGYKVVPFLTDFCFFVYGMGGLGLEIGVIGLLLGVYCGGWVSGFIARSVGGDCLVLGLEWW